MASKVDIANVALGLVGQGVIVALSDSTENAKQCSRFIDESIRQVLRKGKWKGAQKPATLAQLTQVPDFKWSYAYQLPGDYIRMIRFNDIDPTLVNIPVYDIVGKQIWTDESVAEMLYVCDLSASPNDIAAADADMTELFALNLAVKLCWPFQQSRTLRESLNQEYTVKLRMAKGENAQETKQPLVNRLGDSQWLRQRRFSTNR